MASFDGVVLGNFVAQVRASHLGNKITEASGFLILECLGFGEGRV